MIPSIVEAELRRTIIDYLETTFSFQDEKVTQSLEQFLLDPVEGIFKGPYLQLRLPFRRAAEAEAEDFLDIRPSFTPYVHQVTAFGRLTTRDGNMPDPTIVTTGTGSGKTECFLYPILDHCYREIGKPGIKAIVLYPMNALAEDQAGRFAREIWEEDRMRGKVTVGMYIGGKGRHRTMGSGNVITDREVLREHPPDVLLTNYKMLDFLMLRPEDQKLWRETGPESVRYLVLDELHTYDGAQGSDVACLIRRLRSKLQSAQRTLCCVGTSATLAGDQATSIADLMAFATKIFGMPFKRDGVITEERLEVMEYLGEEVETDDIPKDLAPLRPRVDDTVASFIERQAKAWVGMNDLDPVGLGKRLSKHGFLRTLIMNGRGSIVEWDKLIERTARWYDDFEALSHEDRDTVLRSLFALVSHARSEESGRQEPFLTCQFQLWVREMSRLVRQVGAEPSFFWRDSVPMKDVRKGLPAIYCRECGYTGWLGFQRKQDSRVSDDLARIYPSYFERNKNVRYFFPGNTEGELFKDFLCPSCLYIGLEKRCPHCQKDSVPVVIGSKWTLGKYPRDLQHCPSCETDFALSLVGSQAASLSSVSISHLYHSRYNTEKKLIAFTDSVQDASHRAGFFGARTYRFILRTAMQAVLEAEPEGIVRLSEFTNRLLQHWESRMDPQELVASFIPGDLRETPEYRELMDRSGGRIGKALQRILFKRLSWEVVMEYGFSARVGRTLDKVQCSTARLDEEKLLPALEKLSMALRNEIEPLKEVSFEHLRHFVVGLLERTRVRGGISHPMLASYADEKGNRYFLSKRMNPHMSPFGPGSPLPRFLSIDSMEKVFNSCITTGTARTWYLDWVQRCLDESLDATLSNAVYRTTLSILNEGGLLECIGKKNASVYSIPQDALLITRHTERIRSEADGHSQTVAKKELEHWLDMPSLAYRGTGTYSLDERENQSFYREIYRSGHVKRIFCREHSGLLSREAREDVEKHFRTGDRADAPNLLTCTPTLELGINIGDLSSTMLCSIPPDTTNYLQRIGRAGRTTGNSLILALAVVKPHDLYFFDNPLEMVSGMVTPPGCYLDAPEMLKRQYLAFCLDSWAGESDDARQIPNQVRFLLAQNRKGEFPQTFLKYLAKAGSELIIRFLKLFEKYITSDNLERLRDWAHSDSIQDAMNSCLERTDKELADLRRRRKLLKDRRDRIEAEPQKYDNAEEAIKDLGREMVVLGRMITQIQKKYPLNLFTDEGLLPNYAFPESGVKLQSVVYGIPGQHGILGAKDGKELVSETHEYLRGAREAIRDFAPFNTFYAESRKMVIDQVEIGGRQTSNLEVWRFCNACAHMALEATESSQRTCPQCGSAGWEDIGQSRQLLKLEQVSSRERHFDCQTGDESDDRERKKYELKDFISVRPENWRGGFADQEGSFGFEFLNQVTMREINFGLKDGGGKKFKANGESLSEDGFAVCADCGVVKDRMKVVGKVHHRYWCYYNQGDRKPEWRHIFLYRQVSSEALRILLPFSTLEVESRLATFQACLELGLRRKFKGNPIHLVIRKQKDPGVGGDSASRNFLVLYDSVPGGSGYLKEFALNPAAFREVLEGAFKTLKSCNCRKKAHVQGCYRCIYAYSRQYQLDVLSRELGIELMDQILKRWDKLGPVETLSKIDLAPDLIESELEGRFRDSLGSFLQSRDVAWKKVLLSGKACYEFELEKRKWILEPQVELGKKHGVDTACKPDFLLRPAKEEAGVLPVAVFLDGFTYHVQPELPVARIADDVEKRMAILRSGRFLVWSIMWDDVGDFDDDPHAAGVNLLLGVGVQGRALTNFLKKLELPLPEKFLSWSSMVGLINYLKDPDPSKWQRAVAAAALIAMRPLESHTWAEINKTVEMFRKTVTLGVSRTAIPTGGDVSEKEKWFGKIHAYEDLALVVAASEEAANQFKLDRIQAVLRLEDIQERRQTQGYKDSWRKFLATLNLLQFLPKFECVTAEYVRERVVRGMDEAELEEAPVDMAEEPPVEAEEAVSAEVGEVLEMSHDTVKLHIHACAARGLPLPDPGYELASDGDKVLGQCELAWPDHKVAVFLPEDEESLPVFEKMGWKVLQSSKIEEDSEPLLKLLTESSGDI